MRILFVSGEFPPQAGGVGDYTDRLAGALADRGEEVSVLTSVAPTIGAANEDTVWANREGARVDRVVRRWNLGAWSILAGHIRRLQPDVVHIQYQAGAYAVRGAITLYPWLLRAWNIRPLLAVTFHDVLTPHLFPLSGRLGLDRAAVGWLARGADAAIGATAEDAQALVAMNARRVWEIPIGANIPVVGAEESRGAWRERFGIEADAPLLAFFGFLTPGKGAEDLLQAFGGLLATRPQSRLAFIGGGVVSGDRRSATYAGQLREQARALGIAERLVWPGYAGAAAVSGQLRAADLVVLPYRDGASLRRGTLMAALSHGCAIVTTTAPVPIPELADAVVFCPPGKPDALRRAIEEALGVSTQQRLRAAARASAQQFSWPAIADAHSAVYRALCRPSK